MVFKTVGFIYDKVLPGIAGITHTYLEFFMNFTKRLFNWIFELFDNKIVPNVPDNKPSLPKNYPWSNDKL
jgi:hypothetical protein